LLACLADKLELLSEKTNAHSDVVRSVAFPPDGTKIVSGSHDQTIKVWDLGAPEPSKLPSWPKLTPAGLSGRQTGAAEREDECPQQMDQLGGVFPDGTKIVSGSDDKTIKVWDSGAPQAQNRPSLSKTDACWLVWQPRWGC
jgi:WD40 repeat protein